MPKVAAKVEEVKATRGRKKAAEKVEDLKPAKMKKANVKAATKESKEAAEKESKPRVKRSERGPDYLTSNEELVLKALAKASRPLSRKDLAEKTDISKGWSKMLGATTKEDLGASGDDSLEGRGLVKHVVSEEGRRGLAYVITEKGKKLVAKLA